MQDWLFGRRELLKGGTLGALGLCAAGLPGAARAAAAPALRRRAFHRLATGLAGVPGGRFRGLEPGPALRAYDTWYAAQPAPMRAHADAVLDGLAAQRGGPAAIARRPAGAALLAAGVALLELVTEAAEDDARAHAPAL